MEAIATVFNVAGPVAALVSIILLAVLMVWRGQLVPRAQVAELTRIQDERLRESRERELEWREAWKTSEAARAIAAEGFDALLEGNRTLQALVKALPEARPRGGAGT